MVKRIGRYTIENELGRGAFGRVYRAFDPNLKIYVAIKVLIAEDDPELLVRFQAEARATAGLLHPNIVTLYEFSEEAGAPYLVMELLDGQTLQEVIGKPLSLLDKVNIMYQVAEGLRHAHAKGVVHRDMKPGNIMVLKDGVTKILDFGIARLLDKDGTRRSRQGDFAGTIPYMAPELFHGVDADKLADIFAYGVIFYELLTGEQPFYAKDPGTVMYRITTYEPPPLRETIPEVPPALENLVRRLMAKERELRVEKMEDAVFDIQPVLQQLRQVRAAAIAAEICSLMETGDFENAKSRIEQVLKLDPLHVEARQWREQLQLQSQKHALHARAEAMLRKGNEDMEARRFAEAVQCFETAFKLDSSQIHAGPLLEQAKAMLGKARGAARLVAEARGELEQAQIDKAYEKASEAMKLDPGNREAVHLCKDLSRHIRDRRTDETIGRAEELRSLGQHEEALAALAELELDIAAMPKATRLREGIEADRAEVARRRSDAEFKVALTTAAEALSALRLEEAEDAAQELCSRFPNQPAAEEFLAEVRERRAAQRRLDAIGAIMQSARGLIRGKRFEDARVALEDGLRAYPGDANLQRLLDTVLAMASAQQRAEAIQAVVKQANVLRDNGELERGLEAVDAAIAQFGPESVLVECKRNLEFEREQRDYALGLDKVLREARLLLENNRPVEAVARLEDAISRYPGEPELAGTLASARDAVADLREHESRREARARIAACEAAGQFDGALAEAEAALKRHSDDTELLAAAERLRDKLRDKERGRALAKFVIKIETALRVKDWSGAAASLTTALLEFPGDQSLGHFSSAIEEGRRRDELVALDTSVRLSFGREDFAGALEQLASARDEFYQETTWQSLWQELERLLLAAGDRLAETVALLEGAASRHPGEPEVAQALDSARRAFAAWREQESVRQAQTQIAALEAAGKFDEALAQAQVEQARHQRDPVLAAAVRRLRDKVRDQARARALATSLAKIKNSIASGDWDQASENLEAAKVELGADPALVDFSSAIQQGRRTAEIRALETGVRESLSRHDLAYAVEQLVVTRAALSQSAPWQALWSELEHSQLSDGDRLPEAIALLESIASRYRGDPELQRILVALRKAAADLQERRVREALQGIATQEAAGQIREGLGLAQAALERYAGDARIGAAVKRLQAKLHDQERAAALEKHAATIRVAIAAGDWARASSNLESAEREIGADLVLSALKTVIQAGQQQAELKALETRVRESFARRDLESATRQLETTKPEYASEAAWQALSRELEFRKAYETGLGLAEKAAAEGEFGRAQDILRRLVPQAPDERAGLLLKAVSDKRQVEEKKRERARAIANGRTEAAEYARKGDLESAISVLSRLSRQFPESAEIRKDLEDAGRQLEICHIAAQVGALLSKGNAEAAIDVLQRTPVRLSDFPEIRDLVTAAQNSLQEKRQAYSRGRSDVETLTRQQDYDAAIKLLRTLLLQFPDDEVLNRELRDAIATRDRHEKDSRIAAQLSRMEELYRSGRARAVQKEAIDLLNEQEVPRARELLTWANTKIAAEVERTAPPSLEVNLVQGPIARIPSRKLVWLAAAVLLLMAMVFIIWSKRMSSRRNSKIDSTVQVIPPVITPAPKELPLQDPPPKRERPPKEVAVIVPPTATKAADPIRPAVEPLTAEKPPPETVTPSVKPVESTPSIPVSPPIEAPKPANVAVPEPAAIAKTNVPRKPTGRYAVDRGNCTWTGTLAPNGILDLARNRKPDLGSFTCNPSWPPGGVSIVILDPLQHVEIQKQPSEDDDRVRFHNTGEEVTLIQFVWRLR